MNTRPAPQNFMRKSSRPYQTAFAKEAERLTTFGATQTVLEDWFAVDAATLERWAAQHAYFNAAPKVRSLSLTFEDYTIIHWLKDYWLGNL